MKHILIVEDDITLGNALRYNLLREGYAVTLSASAAEAHRRFKKSVFDLVILDVGLPDGSGFSLCRIFKELRREIPVIFLPARDLENDMLEGFELGAADYITKPFPIRVLLKKIDLLLSSAPGDNNDDIYDDGRLIINFSHMTAVLNGVPLTFTASEYRILKLFSANANTALTRRLLLEKLYDADENFVEEHTLTSAVSRIRKKLQSCGGDYIKTIYGLGYMWLKEEKK